MSVCRLRVTDSVREENFVAVAARQISARAGAPQPARGAGAAWGAGTGHKALH